MGLEDVRVAGVTGFVVAGVLTTVGAVLASLLVSSAVQGALALARWIAGIRSGRGSLETGALRGRLAARLAPEAEHAALARQVWWRLPC